MHILFVVPYTPSLIRVRSFNLIRHLTSRGNQVTVLTLGAGTRDESDARFLSAQCHQVIQLPITRLRSAWNCLGGLLSEAPLQSTYSWQPAMARGMDELLRSSNGRWPFDVVHVEHLRGVRYGLLANQISQSTGQSLPVVWDSVDCISLLFRQAAAQSKSTVGRWMTRFELGRTERYEGWLPNQFSQVLVTSAADKNALLELVTAGSEPANINVVPNGVDLEYFSPDPEAQKDRKSLVVSGKMSYHANITMVLDLVQNIMPLVWAEQNDIELLIVGKDPAPSVQKLGESPLITVTGEVEDIRPFLRKAAVAVAPVTYGAGIQNKVLEAMACATPVVTSHIAAGSLQAVNGRDIIVAEDNEQFAQGILGLLADPDEQNRLGSNGRKYVEAHHQWDKITSRLEEIYRLASNDSRKH